MKYTSILRLQIYKIVFTAILSFAFMNTVFPQSVAEGIKKSFAKYTNNNYQEKIFLHTDKTVYATGEILWFKAYLLNESYTFSSLSKIVYVEILSNDNKALLQAKVSIDSGRGDGSFVIPAFVRTGNYVVRAYTNWMKNFDAALYFSQVITIINPNKKPAVIDTGHPDSMHINFFAEGGHLVAGLQNTVAFKITGKDGKGLPAKGFIVSGRDTAAAFETLKFGMGSFSFMPAKGKLYHAVIQVNDTVYEKFLPDVQNTGWLLHITKNAAHILISVQCNAGAPHEAYVLVQSGNTFKKDQKLSLAEGSAIWSIEENDLPDGISQITVFNENSEPVCERLYFKKPAILQLKSTGLQEEYGTRSKVNMQVFTDTSVNHITNANLSVSVYLVDSLQAEQMNNIVSYLWLASELKGNIESPAYYFDSTNGDAWKAADNLMLTQGWRRFQWRSILKNTLPEMSFLPEYEGQIITGRIAARLSKLPLSSRPIYLSAPGKNFRFSKSLSAADGSFLFNMDKFFGNRELVAQTDIADSNYRIFIDNPFAENFSEDLIPGLHLISTQSAAIALRSIGAQAQSVYQPAKQDNFSLPSGYDTTAFYGIPFKTYYLDNYTRFPTMEEVMKEYVKEVHVRRKERGYRYEVFNEPDISYFNNEPLTLIDGVPVFDVSKIINMDPLKIQKVDITATRFYKSGNEYDGIVSYATYNGDLDGYQLEANSLVAEYDGLQYKREFYQPPYETALQQQSRLPDYRNVLYWNPSLHIEKDIKDVSFYTSDVPGTYVIMLQGVTDKGLAGVYTRRFEVK